MFLIVLDEDHMTFALCEVVACRFLSDYMKPNFEIVSIMMQLLFIILKVADKQLYEFLMNAKMEPFFATSWLLTWLYHDLTDIDDMSRLFDASLCSHPMYCYYICVAYMQYIKMEIMEVECDFATVYNGKLVYYCIIYIILYNEIL